MSSCLCMNKGNGTKGKRLDFLRVIMLIGSVPLLSAIIILTICAATKMENELETSTYARLRACAISVQKYFEWDIREDILEKDDVSYEFIDSLQKDHRNDTIVTTCTLLSVISNLFGVYWLDGAVGVGISIVIAISGIKIFIESYNILMDKSIDEKTKSEIVEITKKYKNIKKINHLTSTPVGYKYLISISIFVDGNMSTFDSHKIADRFK